MIRYNLQMQIATRGEEGEGIAASLELSTGAQRLQV